MGSATDIEPRDAAAPQAPATRPAPIFQRLDMVNPAPYPRDWYPRKLLWEICWRLLYRTSPRQLVGFRRWLLRKFGAKVAATANLRPSSKVWHPWIFEIGEHSCLADGVIVYNLGPVHIGDHTVLSQDAYICAGTHDYTVPSLPLQRPTIRIGSGVWICAKAFIGPGVTIADNALIGACAVVTRDVPAGVIAAGNPAKVIRPRPMPTQHEPVRMSEVKGGSIEEPSA